MAKQVDSNGYWLIKKNPISKVGVFPYLGKTIDDSCEPNKIYKVFRSPETLRQSVPTWDNPPKPFINDHEMLGEGFTEIDDRPVQGIIYNPVFDEDKGVLYADLGVYSESLKSEIENGKKELSLGYFCKYTKQRGVFNGETYDYIQTDMVGNHIALVDSGRCGSDVKVFDHKCTMDSIDINPTDFKADSPENTNDFQKNCDCDTIVEKGNETTEQKGTDMADKREAIRQVMAIAAKPNSDFKGGEEEKIETIAKLLEQSEYSKSEDSDEEEKEEKKTQDKCGKDSDEDKEEKKTEDSEEEEKETEDSDEEEEKKAEDSVDAADVMAYLKVIADGIQKLLGKKTEDEDETEKEDEEKPSEDEDEESEEKKAEDSAVVVFGQDSALDTEDPAIKKYLAD